MPSKASLLLSFFAAFAVASSAHAATITLIGPALLNGGFETNGVGGTYATGSNWFNYGAGTETTALYNGTHFAGSYGGIVSAGSNPSISTGRSIAEGDIYNLSFNGFSSNAAVLAANPIRWNLYYYATEGVGGFDQTSAISAVSLFSGVVTNATVTTNSTWALASTGALDTGTLDGVTLAAAAGKTLYLEFYRATGDGVFPVIDNVTLTATAVPEPSTYGLLGAGALAAAAFVRRRRRA